MKAEELRCGNYIVVNGRTVKANPNHILHAGYRPDNSYLPIPLTPEMLEKAATHKNRDGWYFEFPEVKRTVIITWYDEEQKRVFINSNYVGILHLQYVHQLQNLVFILTGSELPINL